MMKKPPTEPLSPCRAERGFTLVEMLVVVAILGMIVVISIPSLRRSMVRAEMMGQVKTIETAIAVCRMKAIKEGEWVVLELLKNEGGGTVWTAPGGRVFAWVDKNRNRKFNSGSEELFHEWFLNTKTAILKEGGNRRIFNLRLGYKGIVFLPSGTSIATKAGVPGVGRGSVVFEDTFGNRIRLQVWSSTATIQLTMWDPEAGQWSDELRFWTY